MYRKRHDQAVDIWSSAHFFEGIVFVQFLPPLVALALLAAWEPFENFVLSPLLWRYFKINFGHESLRNALGDIYFDALGIAIGLVLLQLY